MGSTLDKSYFSPINPIYRLSIEQFYSDTLLEEKEIQGFIAEELNFTKHGSHIPMSRLGKYKKQADPNQLIEKVDGSLNRFGMGLISIQSDLEPSEVRFSSGYGEGSFFTGVLHLYRHLGAKKEFSDAVGIVKHGDSRVVITYPPGLVCCILAIPCSFSIVEFIKWLGSWSNLIQHYRFIRDGSTDRYICLVRFEKAGTSRSFMDALQGRLYSSFHAKQCHIVQLDSVELILTNVSSENSKKIQDSMVMSFKESRSIEEKLQRSIDWVELPTCPVCLERLDSASSGIMTTFCHHTFHCRCLYKWNSSNCPICRCAMVQTFRNAKRKSSGSFDAALFDQTIDQSAGECNITCNNCSSDKKLWICLICGNIGCGRYQNAHAYDHFVKTNHLFALDLATNHVWDYAGDQYVHRLYQNKDDGKLLHQDRIDTWQDQQLSTALMLSLIPGSSDTGQDPGSFLGKKIPPLHLSDPTVPRNEDNNLASIISMHGESQMDYMQQCVDQVHREYKILIQDLQERHIKERSGHQTQMQKLEEKLEETQEQIQATQTIIQDLKQQLMQKENLISEEKLISDKLHRVVQNMTKDIKEKQNTIEELNSQISDLCLHFQAQEALENSPQDQEHISLHHGGSIRINARTKKGNSSTLSKKKS
jgi:BRCA1-associated protein